jgi:hypothetical protein
MWLFKRKKGIPATAVINDGCYNKLPDALKSRFYPAPDDAEVTHRVESEEDEEDRDLNPFFLMAIIDDLDIDQTEEAIDLNLGSSSQPTENYSIDAGNFGGGSGGGAGASDSY